MRLYLLCFTLLWASAASGLAQSHAGMVRSIRQIDFQNFNYKTDVELVRISNGRGVYQGRGKEVFSYKVERVKIAYGDLTGDGEDEAAVILYYTGGGTGAFSKGFLFTLHKGQLNLLNTIEGGDRADRGINEVRIVDSLLWVERNEPERINDVPVGLCCAQYLITTKYRLHGKKLTQVGEAQKVDAN
jgi:hypothetical protein